MTISTSNYGSASYGLQSTFGSSGYGGYTAPTTAVTAPTSTSGSNGFLSALGTGVNSLVGSAFTAAGNSLPNWFGASTTSPPGNPVNPTAAPAQPLPNTAAYGTSGNFSIGGITVSPIDMILLAAGVGLLILFHPKG